MLDSLRKDSVAILVKQGMNETGKSEIEQIERKYALIKKLASDHEEILLKIGEMAESIHKFNETNPQDRYFHLESDVVHVLDAMFDVIFYPAKFEDPVFKRRLSSFTSIGKVDLVQAFLLAMGRSSYRYHDANELRGRKHPLGGRRPRLVPVKEEIQNAWRYFIIPPVFFDLREGEMPTHFFNDCCKEIEKKYKRATVLQGLKELCDGI